MVSYFKELEDPNDYYLNLINTRSYCRNDVDLKVLPLEFFEKYSYLFSKIKNLDLLFEINDTVKKLYMNSDVDCLDIPLEWEYSFYINGYGLDETNLSKNGIDKINYLKEEYSSRYKNDNFIDDFEIYFMAIYDYFLCSDKGITSSKNSVYKYISSAKTIAKYQDKLSKDDEKLFDEALEYIKNYKIKIPHKEFKSVRMYLPNSWYITPYNHLYNTMGINGHKEANLIYPFYYSIIRDDDVANPYSFLNDVRRILEQGCVDKTTFGHYTNLKYDFCAIYSENYFELNSIEKMKYRIYDKKTYNPKIVKLVEVLEVLKQDCFHFFII